MNMMPTKVKTDGPQEQRFIDLECTDEIRRLIRVDCVEFIAFGKKDEKTQIEIHMKSGKEFTILKAVYNAKLSPQL